LIEEVFFQGEDRIDIEDEPSVLVQMLMDSLDSAKESNGLDDIVKAVEEA